MLGLGVRVRVLGVGYLKRTSARTSLHRSKTRTAVGTAMASGHTTKGVETGRCGSRSQAQLGYDVARSPLHALQSRVKGGGEGVGWVTLEVWVGIGNGVRVQIRWAISGDYTI